MHKKTPGSSAHFESIIAEAGIPDESAKTIPQPIAGGTKMAGGDLFHADLKQKIAVIQSSSG